MYKISQFRVYRWHRMLVPTIYGNHLKSRDVWRWWMSWRWLDPAYWRVFSFAWHGDDIPCNVANVHRMDPT